MESSLQHNLPEYSVSDINRVIKGVIETNFDYVRIRGEISGFKLHHSGIIYFNLKDENSIISAIIHKFVASKIKTLMEDGLEIIVSGKITIYPGQSKYQIIVQDVELAGIGALMKLFEERKQRLQKQGLFTEERKRRIPFLPNIIGIISSKNGAVIHDICHRISERFPREIVFYHSLMQGEKAANSVIEGIKILNALKPEEGRPDVIIIARGGGSIEDLFAFNDEDLVKAVAASVIPIISAIGHETDTTLIDYASDKRAPTPTAAAEMAVPVLKELRTQVAALGFRLESNIIRTMKHYDEKIGFSNISLKKPTDIIKEYWYIVDKGFNALSNKATLYIKDLEENLSFWSNKIRAIPSDEIHKKTILINNIRIKTPIEVLLLKQSSINKIADIIGSRVSYLFKEKEISFEKKKAKLVFDVKYFELQQLGYFGKVEKIKDLSYRYITNNLDKLDNTGKLLASFDYRNVIKRGYAIVRNKNDKAITKVSDIKEQFIIEMQDGRIAALPVDGKLNAKSIKPKQKKNTRTQQDSLF